MVLVISLLRGDKRGGKIFREALEALGREILEIL
jgi:hypothetical protein